MADRRRKQPETSHVRTALVLIVGLILGFTVWAFVRSSMGNGPLGIPIAVALAACAGLGGIVVLMDDGIEAR